MNVQGRGGLVLAALAIAAATGCAPMGTTGGKPTSPAAPASTSASTSTTPTPAEPAPGVTPAATVVDSTTPSPDAQRVLARIPEPLTPAQQALNPTPDSSRTRVTAIAPAASYDSLQAAPIPSATQPLGTETSTVTMGETPPAAAPAAASAPPAGGAGSGAAAPAATGAAGAGAAAAASGAATGSASSTPAASPTSPCWRLQVGAPLESEKDKADSRLEAAQSLLMAPFTIVPEKGYLKIRTRDCMTRETADALKKRAVDSGFSDAFLVDTSAKPPATKHQRVPASKRKQ